jgi:hypothetical protein
MAQETTSGPYGTHPSSAEPTPSASTNAGCHRQRTSSISARTTSGHSNDTDDDAVSTDGGSLPARGGVLDGAPVRFIARPAIL